MGVGSLFLDEELCVDICRDVSSELLGMQMVEEMFEEGGE
jgi:hypothetical protein